MKLSCLAVKFLWFAGCLCACLARTTKKMDLHCFADVDCQVGHYCMFVNDSGASAEQQSQQHMCFPCQNCSALQRQTLRSCEGNELSQCGPCLEGYQGRALSRVNNDSCGSIAMSYNSSFHTPNPTLRDNDDASVTVEKTTLMTSQVLLLIGIALAALAAAAVSVLLGRLYQRRLTKRSYDAVSHLKDLSARKLPEVHPSQSTEPLVYWDASINFDEEKPSMT